MILNKIAYCVLLVGFGCTSGSSRTAPRPEQTEERIDVSGALIRLDVDRTASNNRIAVNRTDSWAVIAEVFDSLSIPLEFADQRNYRAGNQRFILPRQIAGQPKSLYLRCGLGPAGPLADSHRVTMSLITELHVISPDSTGVFTQIAATARATEGTSTERVLCASTGVLEKTLAGLVSRRAAAKRK